MRVVGWWLRNQHSTTYELCGDVRNPKIACQSPYVRPKRVEDQELQDACRLASMMRSTNRVIQKNCWNTSKNDQHCQTLFMNDDKYDKCKPHFVCSTDCSRLYVAKWMGLGLGGPVVSRCLVYVAYPYQNQMKSWWHGHWSYAAKRQRVTGCSFFGSAPCQKPFRSFLLMRRCCPNPGSFQAIHSAE